MHGEIQTAHALQTANSWHDIQRPKSLYLRNRPAPADYERRFGYSDEAGRTYQLSSRQELNKSSD